jgi:hypothetical protein
MKHLGLAVLVCVLPLRLFADSKGYAQSFTDELRSRLQILEVVHFTLVEHNPLVMSVETLAGRSGPFIITADQKFVQSLSDEELKAAIAHELGHVWIYTHHPYLQTERLANDIALRVTSADVLVPVYEKVWKRIGARGNLAEVISIEVKPGSR